MYHPLQDYILESEVQDFTVPSKNRTILLMRLNLAAYPSCKDGANHGYHCGYSDDTMETIFERGESLFGQDIKTTEQESAARDALHDKNWELLLDDAAKLSISKISVPESTAEFGVGVEALEATTSDTTILAFRGTYTAGDYNNIENWMTDYLLEKSTDRMKEAWTKDAGLAWTDELERRASQHDDRWAKLEIRAAESYLFGREEPLKAIGTHEPSFAKTLVEAVAANETLNTSIGGLTLDDVESTGYWKLTKFVVDQAFERAKHGNRTLVLTGHSQGGTRAQLASMYLHQKNGIQCPTVTFAATGSACLSRLMFDTDANLLDDVDPFVMHDHMVDYVHPLDPWGNAMLGVDNGGDVCFWGSADARRAQQAFVVELGAKNITDNSYTYCSEIYGWSGATLIAAQAGVYAPGGVNGVDARELTRNFGRCRYFTHMAESVLLELMSPAALMENGSTTDCHKVVAIPINDPDGQCPTGKLSWEEEKAAAETAFLIVLLLWMVCVAFALCFCRVKKNLNKTHNIVNSHDELEAADDLALQPEDEAGLELPGIANVVWS